MQAPVHNRIHSGIFCTWYTSNVLLTWYGYQAPVYNSLYRSTSYTVALVLVLVLALASASAIVLPYDRRVSSMYTMYPLHILQSSRVSLSCALDTTALECHAPCPQID